MTSLDNVYSVDSGAILSRALLEEVCSSNPLVSVHEDLAQLAAGGSSFA